MNCIAASLQLVEQSKGRVDVTFAARVLDVAAGIGLDSFSSYSKGSDDRRQITSASDSIAKQGYHLPMIWCRSLPMDTRHRRPGLAGATTCTAARIAQRGSARTAN